MKMPSYMTTHVVINQDGTMSINMVIRKWHPGWWLLLARVAAGMTFGKRRRAK